MSSMQHVTQAEIHTFSFMGMCVEVKMMIDMHGYQQKMDLFYQEL